MKFIFKKTGTKNSSRLNSGEKLMLKKRITENIKTIPFEALDIVGVWSLSRMGILLDTPFNISRYEEAIKNGLERIDSIPLPEADNP